MNAQMRVLVRELIETVILALLIFLLLHLSIGNRKVEGPSMEPTLASGEYVIVNKLVYLNFHPGGLARLVPFLDNNDDERLFAFHPPRRGDIIVFRFPADQARDFVKRVVAVPGETVEIKQGRLFVNGVEVAEPYITRRDSSSMTKLTVEIDHYFVLGDNRLASRDSRAFGAVPFENIIGRAWISFWPLDRLHALRALPLP